MRRNKQKRRVYVYKRHQLDNEKAGPGPRSIQYTSSAMQAMNDMDYAFGQATAKLAQDIDDEKYRYEKLYGEAYAGGPLDDLESEIWELWHTIPKRLYEIQKEITKLDKQAWSALESTTSVQPRLL